MQSVVERKLQKEKNLSKHDLGRDAFIDEVWKWNEQYGGKIMNQLDHIGAIVEKDQSYFTLDETRCVALLLAACESSGCWAASNAACDITMIDRKR